MEIDVDRQHKAREYARIKRRLSYVSMGIGVISIVAVLSLGLDKWLRDVLQQLAGSQTWLSWQPVQGWYPFQTVLYFLIVFIVYEMLTLPLAYYGGYVLPHRYGISVMSLKAWLRDLGLGFVLSTVLEAAFILLVYALLAYQPQFWWLWAAVIILLFSVVMANLAPVLILPLFYKFTPLPEGELTERLLALAARAQTRVQGVFHMKLSHKTNATNAALMGLGNTRRIVLGDNMTDRYTTDEIEVILAHELGHHVHHDIWKLIVSQTLLTLAGLFVANLVLQWAVVQQGYYKSLTDPATLPFLFMLIGIFSFIIMPISNGYSRRIEYQADEYALTATGKVDAFKGAMKRLANQNLADIEPAPLIEFLFHSHPSIKKRLDHADEFATRDQLKASASFKA